MPEHAGLPMWTGVRLVPWLRRLAANGFRVAPARIPRALGITAAAVGNEALAAIQWAIWGRGLARARLEADPIVVVGHWRSGTTLLHELLACDPRLTAPNTLQCAAPAHFVLSEEFARTWLGFLLPERRPMDAMRLGFDRPQEDELALCNLGLPSPWWIVAFPNEPPPDPEYEDLESLTPAARDRWLAAWTGFLRAVQFEHPGRLVLKNPLHTFRLPTIRAAFPAADVIHLVRDPRTMVPSCLHFWRRIAEAHGLQRPAGTGLEDRVISSVLRMERRIEATWEAIPSRHRFRARYEDLVADPMGVLRSLYAHFGWPGAAEAEPRWQARLAESNDYRPNALTPDDALARRIETDLAVVLTRHGYADGAARDR
jgi:omega-hydroxy-beta-dihydromenaquinone-9 sulfotransferase